MIRITKLKLTDKLSRVRVEYEQKNSVGGWDEFTIHSADSPEPELLQSLANLAGEMVAICELHPSDVEKVSVTGVSFSYSESEEMGATLIGRKHLARSNAPINLVTPHKVDKHDADDMQRMMPKMVDLLERVVHYAARFIDGRRAQQTIFDYQTIEDRREVA